MKPANGSDVSCLCIDLIGSTKAGLSRTTQQNDTFNQALVDQIKPHLQELGLDKALVKFTGDGWLVMTSDTNQRPALCCLALIQANRFQSEMSKFTKVPADKIPSLR